MSEDDYIWATPDMVKPLDPDVMMEWEAIFAEIDADMQEGARGAFADEYRTLDAKPRKTKADNQRMSRIAQMTYMTPVGMLAVRLCEATRPLEGEPTMTYVQAARGWFIFDSAIMSMATKQGKPRLDGSMPKLTVDKIANHWIEGIASLVYEQTKASLYTERAKALVEWQTRYEKEPPPPLPPADRAFPGAWVMAMTNGEMTPREVADRWLAGEQPSPGSGDGTDLG